MERITTGTTGILSAITASSFETIFKTYYKGLVGYAYTLTKNESVAEGIVQQVFLKLWEKREELTIDVSVKAYLYKSVYNYGLNHLKHKKIKSTHEKYIASQPDLLFENAEDKILSSELKEKIKSALDQLPEQCGIVFKMNRFEGLKYQEIANKLGLSIKTVEAHMGKALRMMREKLAEYLPMIIVFYLLTGNLLFYIQGI